MLSQTALLYKLSVFAPLTGSAIAGLFGRVIGDRAAQIVTLIGMVLAAICGDICFAQLALHHTAPGTVTLGTWMSVGGFHTAWALRYDTLSVMMVAMVTSISTLIHLYSVGYMNHDKSIARFFSYLSLFTFAMLMLVTSDNLLQLFFGWEGVGLASYLLIGFWYDKPSACRAAMKAFIVNRVADLFFAVGIALVFFLFGSIGFSAIFAEVPQYTDATYHIFQHDYPSYEVIGVLLFIGACGKSAQLFFHTWLPDAMEGPTPVSALIHAATMVTAGVFLMARMSPLFEYAPHALQLVTVIGASTCFFAATIGCVQTDIKRVIAYSTCSQLGYMFLAAGVGAYQTSVFHLFTHAFFKALLFLSAGSVIHAMSDEQDIMKMGGLAKKIPITCVVMWIGSLALAGIPPFAGFYSKDAILEAAYAAHTRVGNYAYTMGVIAAFLTAFYSWRVLILTFHGTSRADHHTFDHAHESPAVMLIPLILLATGAVLVGYLFKPWFIGEGQAYFWQGAIVNGPHNHILAQMEEIPSWVGLAPLVVGLIGIGLAYVMYMLSPSIPGKMARAFRPIYLFLLNKWYFDELYDVLFVRPVGALARVFWKVGDVMLIDGVPNGVAKLTAGTSNQTVKLQTGSIAVYAFTMLIGLVALISLFLVFK